MANTPTPKSYEELLGEMLTTYMSRIGINDMNTGSVITSFFEAAAQTVARSSGDIFSILRDYSVDRATGEALQRIAKDERIQPLPARVATGDVTITDTSFNKIQTKIYAGSNSVNVGTVSLQVSDASLFPTTGSVYIGRGTANIEGPIAYSSVTNIGSYYVVNLVTPTTKFHNLSETVIVAQGGTRTVAGGTQVRTPASGSTNVVTFSITQGVLLLDGENQITNVPVYCTLPGVSGNIPANAIKEFVAPPFVGASVTNPLPYITGRNTESDDELRNRIKQKWASVGLGTEVAIKNSVINAQATDENATVVSSQISKTNGNTVLYIDDGRGYEEKTAGTGLETIVDSALGGEKSFKLITGGIQTSVAKATLISNNTSPFAISPGDRLAILVGGILTEHVFSSGDFRVDGQATSYEIVASINANSLLAFSARTLANGSQVAISAKSEVDEYIQYTTPTTGNDAGIALLLSSDEVDTLRLYKNNIPLSKDGKFAEIQSANQVDWAPMADGETLIISVDNTDFITYTFNDSDFLSEGSFSTVSSTNSLQSWVNVINSKVTGVTAYVNGINLVITSNLQANSRARLEISNSSTLVATNMFNTTLGLQSSGSASDYTLSRNTGDLELTVPLTAGDKLTAGNAFSNATISSTVLPSNIINLASDASLWFLLDNPTAQIINTGVLASSVISVIKQPLDTIRIKSELANAFVNVLVGDYVILWSSEVSSVNRIEGRVCAVGSQSLSNDYIEIRLTAGEYTTTVTELNLIYVSGLTVVRTEKTPQKIILPAGSYDINTMAAMISEDLVGGSASVTNDEIINILTNTKDDSGHIMLVTLDTNASPLNLTAGSSAVSNISHFAFVSSQNYDGSFPVFSHGLVDSDVYSDTPTTLITSFDSTLNTPELGEMVVFLHPYTSGSSNIQDAQGAGEKTIVEDVSGATVSIDPNTIIRRLRQNDRYYRASLFDFTYNDRVFAIVDNKPEEQTFPIPLYRRVIPTNAMPISPVTFSASDVDSGAANFAIYFGDTFSFDNYHALMQARMVINPKSAVDKDSILYHSAYWGKAGEYTTVGYDYPAGPSQANITHSINLDDKLNIRLNLKSGNSVLTTIDGTTQWDVTITPNTPIAGTDTVSYTYNGIGTAPGLAAVNPGDYVNITNTTLFSAANQGVFKVISSTATSFSVYRPNGIAVVESNIATINSSSMFFYNSLATTAADIVAYVTANLSDYITASILNDNGTDGSGIISGSTWDDSDFAFSYVQMVDGENWIASSIYNIIGVRSEFSFKIPLVMPSYSTNTIDAYQFRNGEEVRLLPVTSSQIQKFISVLAVSGLTTMSDVACSDTASSLQISSQNMGSVGAIQLSGGSGNNSSAIILDVSTVIDNDKMINTISRSASVGFHANQWVKLTSGVTQSKDSDFNNTTTATISTYQVTKSKVDFGNKTVDDLYFGQPRNHIRDVGRSFQVEKHGSLVCISWDTLNGSSPEFSKTVDINDTTELVLVSVNALTGYTKYTSSSLRRFNEVHPGDILTISGFTNAENNGTFTVVGSTGSEISVINPLGVAETTSISAGSFTVTTEVQEGDWVELRAPFNILNRGLYRVIRRFENSIYIDNPNVVEEKVNVVANNRVLNYGVTDYVSVSVPDDMRIDCNTLSTTIFANVKMGDIVTIGSGFSAANQGSFMVTEYGDSYIKCANANAVSSGLVLLTPSNLTIHNPSMVFTSYESAVAGDKLVISGNVMGSTNIGDYVIAEVYNKNSVIINEILTPVGPTSLLDNFNQIYVEEKTPYVGYKRIYNLFVNPSNSTEYSVIFDNKNQLRQINALADMTIVTLNKLNFSETLVIGLDAYKYNTGLLAQVNRIVYGDPRDNTTYPGVAAAGSEIFINPPLIKRIQVSINVRINTSIPFTQIVQQVRSNVASLINSTKIGDSISISSIVSTVNLIPGTRAVSISSPLYDATHDMIVVNPAEKPLILDIVNDITVSSVG